MAEKLTIKKWFEDGLPERYADDGTYLGTHDQGYDICEGSGSAQVGCANDLDVAVLFAASPMLRDALREAYDYIIEVSRQFGIVPEEDVTEHIVAAIAAAEGEE